MDNRIVELIDKQEIYDCIVNWTFWRDQGNWGKLAGCFHPEGTMSTLWFTGPYKKFIEEVISEKKKAPDESSKHVILGISIDVNANRALAQSNVLITIRTKMLLSEVDLNCYVRLVDRFEKRDGMWKILHREAVYEKDWFNFVKPSGIWGLIYSLLNFKKYAPQFKHLGYGLEHKGIILNNDSIVSGSDQVTRLNEENDMWLGNG